MKKISILPKKMRQQKIKIQKQSEKIIVIQVLSAKHRLKNLLFIREIHIRQIPMGTIKTSLIKEKYPMTTYCLAKILMAI